MRRVENRREEREEKIDCVKERACSLQTFYHKNKFNLYCKIVWYFWKKNSCPNCLAYIFWSLKDFWSFDNPIFLILVRDMYIWEL